MKMTRIPKLIHYCWFGKGNKPEDVVYCIESWKKYCPDYEIIEWNENNFDINGYAYAKEAYDAGKWAFVSDVVRLHVLFFFGGVYMDVDVELMKPLDDFLEYEAVSGFERIDRIPTGLMGCRKGYRLFYELLQEYEGARFIKPNGEYDLTTNVDRITNYCLKYGLKQKRYNFRNESSD